MQVIGLFQIEKDLISLADKTELQADKTAINAILVAMWDNQKTVSIRDLRISAQIIKALYRLGIQVIEYKPLNLFTVSWE